MVVADPVVLCTRPSGFNEIMRRLERNRLVRREALPTAPVGVEYRITRLAARRRSSFPRFMAGR
ncbi:winged helix-turn-helix transcriptional regulator [Faunimonas pinastri]|uniref:winged helix-turn-helix transcriptional regulator n=1 Tax=Faunimonas pinastri TaxID=1855383 RepID=UPI001EEBA6E4|nr:winged helix-turn-helix transcriptional regulator [Faunimonas pinastri]